MKSLRKIFFIFSLAVLTAILLVMLNSCGECLHSVKTQWQTTRQATCALEGEKTAKCLDCGETLTQSIKKSAHKYGKYVNDNNQRCDFIGTSTAKCEGCSASSTKLNDGNPYGHTYFDGVCSLCKDTMTLMGSWDASKSDADSVTVKIYKASDGHHELDVVGEGEMRDFSADETTPWESYASNVTTIHFYEGVTRIGARAFKSLEIADHVYLEKGVKSFGKEAFANGFTPAITHVFDMATWVSLEFEDEGIPGLYNTTLIYVGDIVKNAEGKKSVKNASTTVGDLKIPEGVEKINPYSFYNCAHMLTVSLPDSIKEIGDWAFYGCERLNEVHISSIEAWCNIRFGENYSNPLAIGENLLVDGELVQHLIIPDTVTSIPRGAFEGASCITKLTFGTGITAIPEYAFYNCYKIREIEFASQIESIGAWSFYGCESVIKLEIPESVTSVGNDAFRNCTKLALVSTGGVTELDGSVFSGCRELVHITLGKALTKIEKGEFAGCNKVVEIINLSAIDISSYSFIKNAIKIYSSEATSKIVITDDGAEGKYNDFVFYEDDGTRLLLGYVGSDTKLTLTSEIRGADFDVYSRAFYRSFVKELIIIDGVKSFGADAFLETAITSVKIPSVEFWCGLSFAKESSNPLYYTTKLFIGENENEVTEITVPESTVAIPAYAFAGLGQVKKFILHDKITSIGKDAFLGCVSALKTSNNVSYIDNWVVAVDKTKTSLSFLTGTKNFADGIFDGAIFDTVNVHASLLSKLPAEKIINLTISGGALTADAFAPFTNLKSLSINSTIKSADIDEFAFRGCTASAISAHASHLPFIDATAVTSLTINGGAIKKEDTARFAGIKSLIITAGVTSAEKASFKGFTSLESVQVNGGLTSLPEEMFSGCTALKTVALHSGIITVGKNAFADCVLAMTKEHGAYYIANWLVEIDQGAEYVIILADTVGIASGLFTSSSSVKAVYYLERSAFWSAIRKNTGSNTKLDEITIYFYREVPPYTTDNFWHFVDGVPTPWPPYTPN